VPEGQPEAQTAVKTGHIPDKSSPVYIEGLIFDISQKCPTTNTMLIQQLIEGPLGAADIIPTAANLADNYVTV